MTLTSTTQGAPSRQNSYNQPHNEAKAKTVISTTLIRKWRRLLFCALSIASQQTFAQDGASYAAWHPEDNTFEIAVPPDWRPLSHPAPFEIEWVTPFPDTTCGLLTLKRSPVTNAEGEFLPSRIKAALARLFGQIPQITLTKTVLDNRPAAATHTSSVTIDPLLGSVAIRHAIIVSQISDQAVIQICSQPEKAGETAMTNIDTALGQLSASFLYR